MTRRFILRGRGILFAMAFLFWSVAAEAAVVPGHVEAWGLNFNGEASPPAGLDGVIAIAAGYSHNLALRTNGTVVAWGSNNAGETIVPPGLSNVVAIAASSFSAAVKADGTVVIWGSNAAEIRNVPPAAVNVTSVAVSGQSVFAVRADGTVVAWGHPSTQLDMPAGLTDVVQVSAGNAHALALTRSGAVIGWGDNFHGQATPPPGLTNIVAVRAGQQTSVVLREDGTVFKWGGTHDMHEVPDGVSGVIDFDLGFQHLLALRADGTVLAWGLNREGQGSVPPLLNGVTAIAAGGNHNLALTARPIIQSITPPVKTTVGATVTLTVAATGQALAYLWMHKGTNIPGGTDATLVVENVQPSDAGTYGVFVSNPHGYNLTGTSISFAAPTISAQPQDGSFYRGESATLSVTVSGFEPFTYQWFKDGAPVPDGTNAAIAVPTLARADSGTYRVTITDIAGGSSTSSNAVVMVIDPRDQLVSLRPSIDTSIHSQGINPQGTATILAGTRRLGAVDRGLLRFDLSSIPTNAVLESASLSLRPVKAPRNFAGSAFGLHRVVRAWGAEATWANRSADAVWGAPGGLVEVDYTSNRVAGAFVPDRGDYVFGSTNELFADLSAWIVDPATNHGWILITDQEHVGSTALHFGSSESTTPPELRIRYSLPADVPLLSNVRREGTNFMFEITGNAGWIYTVESRNAAELGVWTAMTNAPAGAGLSPIVIAIPLTESPRYFRASRH